MRRVGLLADTHSNKNDGSDLPDEVLALLKGVDLIVHLGDVGRKGILPRLASVAPVLVPVGGDKGYVPPGAEAAVGDKVVTSTSGVALGLCFNLKNPDKKIAVGPEGLTFDTTVAALLQRRFKQPVSVVAFAATHDPFVAEYEGVLFVNPGSPTLPMTPPGSVAVVDLGARGGPTAEIKRLS